jgi:hypothetical protein
VAGNTLPDIYTKKDLENARTKGQVIGWVQGAAVAVGGLFLLRVVGWIPTIAILAGGGFLLYKLLSSSKKG